jgi:hypothetical protein
MWGERCLPISYPILSILFLSIVLSIKEASKEAEAKVEKDPKKKGRKMEEKFIRSDIINLDLTAIQVPKCPLTLPNS